MKRTKNHDQTSVFCEKIPHHYRRDFFFCLQKRFDLHQQNKFPINLNMSIEDNIVEKSSVQCVKIDKCMKTEIKLIIIRNL